MPTTDTDVTQLVINKLTRQQYDAIATKSQTELYVVTDDPTGSIITVAGSGGDTYINGTTTISFDNVRSVYGTGLTFDSTNHAVVIGAGISKVKISSSIFYTQTAGGFYYSWYRLYVNGANPTTGEFIGMTNVNASYGTASLAPALVDVSEGDKITLMNIDRGTIRGIDSYMTVEVVA